MRGGTLEVSSQTLERFIFVDLKGRMTESEIKRERMNDWSIAQSQVCSKAGAQKSLCISHMDVKGPSSLSICCCFSRYIFLELCERWSSWDSHRIGVQYGIMMLQGVT